MVQLDFGTELILIMILLLGNLLFRIVGKRKGQLVFSLAVMYLLLLDIILYITAISLHAVSSAPAIYFNFLSVNPFSVFFFFILTLGVMLLNLLAYEHARDYENFALLSSFALAGMYLVAGSATFITVFLGLELMSIPSAFIILLSRRSSLEAATKYLIMASIAIALMSFAIALFYGSTNSLALQPQNANSLLAFAFALFIAAIGFEASVFPFNVMIPDVYQGSTAYAAALLGGINKKVGLIALMQVMILVFTAYSFAPSLIAVLAVLTMFFGNIAALMQTNMKRMLAYSSISQAGYILVGLAANSPGGASASIFQIFAHMFMFIGALSIVAWLERRDREDIDNLIGLYKESRFSALALSFFLLGFIGMPLTTGFVGKFLLFLSAVNSGLAWLAFLGIVNSVISVFYYAKMLTAIYTNKMGTYHVKIDNPTLAVVMICFVIVLVVGIFPQPVIHLADGAAAYLFSRPS